MPVSSMSCSWTNLFGSPVAMAVRVAWQHGIDARDEGAELRHVVSEELSCRFVGDLTVFGNEATLELDIRLDRIHLWRVTERQDAPQVLLRDRGANLPRRRPDKGRRFSCERVLAIGATGPVDRILQAAGNRAVVLGGDE